MAPGSSLITEIFDKDIHALTIEDMQHYFAHPRSETDTLEFKSYIDFPDGTSKPKRDKEKVSDITKAICAFLNSEGGVLIWGAPEGEKLTKESEKTCQGELRLVDYVLRKDETIEKITASITPVPYGIKFQDIRVSDNQFCYIFEVPKSEHRPHQYKGTYYMRLDGATKPAPHGYVEALMKRITYPKLAGFITFGHSNVSVPSGFHYVAITVTIYNTSQYMHEKNLYFRLSSMFGNLFAIDQPIPEPLRIDGFSHREKADDFLYYDIPYVKQFFLVLGYEVMTYRKVQITLDILGERSPALRSVYQYAFGWRAETFNHSSYHSHLDSADENFYLYDRQDEYSGMNELEKMKEKNIFEITKINSLVQRHPLSKK
jgi:hypothetical protein